MCKPRRIVYRHPLTQQPTVLVTPAQCAGVRCDGCDEMHCPEYLDASPYWPNASLCPRCRRALLEAAS